MTTIDKALAAMSAAIGAPLAPQQSPNAKDVPEVPDGLADDLSNYLDGVREVVQELTGARGDPLNRSVRWKDMVAGGYSDTRLNPLVAGLPASTFTSDPTAPPTPTGLTASAGLTSIIVQWDLPVFTQGHGPFKTNVYAVKKAVSDPTLPTFPGAAGLVTSAPYALTLIDIASDTLIRWHIWITYVTKDGYESAAPQGGTNGFQVATGTINGVNLGPLIITADKLSQGTYPNINLVPNPGAEDGTVCWAMLGATGTGTAFAIDTATKAGGLQSFKITKAANTDGGAWGCQAFPVIPGETYSVKVRLQGSIASADGLYLRMCELTSKPASLYVGTATGFAGVDVRTSFTDLVANGAIPSAFATKEFSYLVPAGVYWVSMLVLNWINAGSNVASLWFDDVSVGRQITASFLAAGSIAVGTAAIQNGAIVNAMIGTLAVDDAKIASLDGAKINAGTVTASQIAANTITAAQIAANTITAAQIAATTITATELAAGSVTAAKISVGSLAAITATLGTITSGTINTGSLVIGSSGNIRQGQSAYNTGTGFWIGDVSGTAKFSIGNAGTNALTWNGTTLTLAGALAAATGTFAGTLTAAALTVAGNGIFSPGSGTTTVTQLLNTTINTELTSGSVNPGATGTVLISVTCEYLNGNSTSGAGEDGVTTTYVTPVFYIYRDTGNVQVTTWTPAIGVGSAERQITLEFASDVPGAASTYSLRVKVPSITGTGGDAKVFRRSIIAQGINR